MLEIASKLCEDEKYTQALKYYENILQVEPDSIGVIIDYGVTLQNLERYNQALAMYDRALNLQPKNMNALINKGYKKYSDIKKDREFEKVLRELDNFFKIQFLWQ